MVFHSSARSAAFVRWCTDAGQGRKGKPEDAVFDIERTNRLVPVLVEDCTKEPKASYYKKVKEAVKKAS